MTTNSGSISRSGVTSDNTTCGSEVKPCYVCLKCKRDEKVTISNGMRLVRIRFGIPKTELPDLGSSSLSCYLLFLLAKGKSGRTPLPFPKSQSRIRDKDGLCSLQRLCRRDRWNLAHSLNSIKRNLPPGCKKHTPSARPSWEKAAFSTPPPLHLITSLTYVRRSRRCFLSVGTVLMRNLSILIVPTPHQDSVENVLTDSGRQ